MKFKIRFFVGRGGGVRKFFGKKSVAWNLLKGILVQIILSGATNKEIVKYLFTN